MPQLLAHPRARYRAGSGQGKRVELVSIRHLQWQRLLACAHADGHHVRDMEAVRPQVDGFVLELVPSYTFAVRDFFETREGVRRVRPALTPRFAEMTPMWTKAVAPVAEAIARTFLRSQTDSGARVGRLPTLLTEENRSAGRGATT